MEPKLRHAVRRAGMEKSILIPGLSKDIASLLRDTDVVVLPSENEGLALITFEAMAMGVPIVSTRVQGQDELVPPELLVEFDDDMVVNMADTIMRLLAEEDLRIRMGQKLRRIIAERHSCETTFLDLFALYDELLNAPPN